MTDRRTPDRLDEGELEVDVIANAAGGVIAKVLHRPSRRFASARHRDREEAIRQAKRELARMLARVKRRKAKGLSEK